MKHPDHTERQATETALSRLAAIIESSDDAIIGKDLNSIIFSWNRGAEKIFGYTADEMVGTSILRLIPADRLEEEDFILGTIRRGEKVDHYETVRQAKDGRRIDVSITASPIRDAAGNIVGASKIARDITMLKAHQQEVVRLSRLYAALSQINQAIVWTRHREELFDKICRVLVEFGKFRMAWIGLSGAEGQPVEPVAIWVDVTNYLGEVAIYADDRPEGRGPMGRVIREGKKYVSNDFAQDPNTAPWHEPAHRAGFRAAAAFPIYQRGAVCGAVVVYSAEIGFFRDMEVALLEEAATDISFALDFLAQEDERKQAEQSMRVSEERYRALFDRSLDCVFLYDFAGNFLDANQATLDLLGYQREDIATLAFASLLPEDQFPLAFRVTEEIKTTGHQKRPAEFRLRGKDGREVYVETRCSLIYREGKPFAIQGIAHDLTERKRALEKLQESERNFRTLAEAVPQIVWATRPDGWNIYFNQHWFDYTGMTAEETCGHGWNKPFHPDDQQRARDAWENAVKNGTIYSLESRLRRADGVYRWWLVRGEPLRDEAGKILKWFGTCTDIEDLKQGEAKLAASEQRHRTIINGFSVPLALNCDQQITYLNPAFVAVFGYNRADIPTLAEWWLKAYPDPKYRKIIADTWNAHLEQAKRTGQPFEPMEVNVRCKNGTHRTFLADAAPLTDGNYDEEHMVVLYDITERKQAEMSLRLLNSAVLQAKESIMITDAQLKLPGPKIIFVNPAFTQMTGYTAEEVAGKTPRILQGPRTDKRLLTRLRKTLERGEVFDGEAIQYRKDGTEYDQEWQIAPLRDDAGKITHYVAIQRDVSAHRKLEEQFRQAQKMESFGQLAGGVAHDFNNILAVIQIQAGLLKTEQSLSLEQLDFAREIEKATERGANLTRQLLLFSRKQIMQPRNLKLKDLVENITKMLQRTLGEQCELQFKFSDDSLAIHADPGMIDQILLNLTVNARDAMPKGGRIIIETKAVEFDEITATQTAKAVPGSFVCVSVTDTGCGIPPEILPRIFEPFFTTKAIGKGTGLGLATVFGIVQQHNGWINVYSEVGHGTTFRIYLPRLTDTSDTKFIRASLASIPGGSETILLVEDEAPLRAAVRKTLSRLGYNVLEAATGNEALEVWKQHADKIRLLLTDMMMPGGMTGRELAEALLQQDPKLKVIYASGYSAEIAGRDFLVEEGVNFLSKPFQTQKLAQTIRNCLNAPAIRA